MSAKKDRPQPREAVMNGDIKTTRRTGTDAKAGVSVQRVCGVSRKAARGAPPKVGGPENSRIFLLLFPTGRATIGVENTIVAAGRRVREHPTAHAPGEVTTQHRQRELPATGLL